MTGASCQHCGFLFSMVLLLFLKNSVWSNTYFLQVQGNGAGYQHLMSLAANSHLKHLALACICNLCYTSSSRPALGSVGTVETIIKELLDDQQNNTGEW